MLALHIRTGVYEQTAQTQDLHYLPYHPHFLTYIFWVQITTMAQHIRAGEHVQTAQTQIIRVYIIYESVTSQKVKFADDGTIWRSGHDLEGLAEELQDDLTEISQWVRKWRMKVNIDKREYCIFSRDQTVLNRTCEIKMTNKILNC